MFIYIVRHAWAGHFGDPDWPNDSSRPLTDDGKSRFAKVAKMLAEGGCAPAVIATSPLVRCRQTADILAEHVPHSAEIVVLDALAPGANLEALLRWTAQQGDGDVAWVGHCPDVEHLAAALLGDREAQFRFAKGACAAIRLDPPPRPGKGELYWHATAKLLGC